LARVELPIKLEKLPVARYSLVRAEPETGRYHQIRRHLKHLAHPIVGDVKYGKGEHNRVFRQHYDVHRLLLHAIRLSFNDPKTNERVEVTAPLDAEYERAIRIFSGLDRSTL
jgi:tRNA pseudouridine65 synthase